MNVLKRLIVLILSTVVSVSVFSSCQNRENITITKKENPDKVERQNGIVIWGSSLGFSAYGDNFVNKLLDHMMSDECFIPVENMSVPKESTKTILARAGLNKILVKKDFKLPAGLEAAEITFVAADKSKIFPLRFGTACDGGMTDVTIAGINGTLSIERDTAHLDRPKYYFTRKSEGKEVTIKKGEQIIGDKMDSFKDYIPIICMGEYGEWTNVADLIKQQQQILDRSDDKEKFVIMGMVSVPLEEDNSLSDKENAKRQRKANEAFDNAMAKKWGEHYINIREELCSEKALEIAKEKGIEFDKYDKVSIKNKEVPDAFRYDDENLNRNAYDIIGDIVYDKLVELGYLYH